MYAQSIFSVFNIIWENAPIEKKYRPYLELYSVLPVCKFGKYNVSVIEFVPNTSVQNYNWFVFLS